MGFCAGATPRRVRHTPSETPLGGATSEGGRRARPAPRPPPKVNCQPVAAARPTTLSRRADTLCLMRAPNALVRPCHQCRQSALRRRGGVIGCGAAVQGRRGALPRPRRGAGGRRGGRRRGRQRRPDALLHGRQRRGRRVREGRDRRAHRPACAGHAAEGLRRRGRRYGMRRASKRREGEEGGAPAVVCVASILHAIQANGLVCSMSHGLRRASGVFVGMQSHVSDGTLIL